LCRQHCFQMYKNELNVKIDRSSPLSIKQCQHTMPVIVFVSVFVCVCVCGCSRCEWARNILTGWSCKTNKKSSVLHLALSQKIGHGPVISQHKLTTALPPICMDFPSHSLLSRTVSSPSFSFNLSLFSSLYLSLFTSYKTISLIFLSANCYV